MKKKRTGRMAALLLAVSLLAGCGTAPAQSTATPNGPSEAQSPALSEPNPTGADRFGTSWDQEYRAMWISYLEWQNVDFSTEAAFRAQAQQMLDNCADLGLNTVIAQVRSFADALYPSEIFPWSDLCTGQQGQDPGYDPLAILVEEAHARDLRIEAWINPYRVRLNSTTPAGELAEKNPAVQHPQWAKQVDGSDTLYLDPSSPEVQQYIVQGVTEILEHYPVDGIHFDDYFYPTTDPAFDAPEYAAAGGGLSLEDWRRQNVNTLVAAVYDAVKSHSPKVSFGISPQGNPDNNYNGQYSDVGLWMREGGYVDYVMPQFYWGYGYTTGGGSTRFAFENITKEWAAMERSPSVALYCGLGAYRIGVGDGGNYDNNTAQWNTGHNLADMMSTLRENGFQGYAMFRYQHLFENAEYADMAAQEVDAIRANNTSAP